jgi:uncharacterized protein
MEALQYFQHHDVFSWQVIAILIAAGLVVGIINTLAGNGTVITYTLFLLMGYDTYIANGTPRLGVVMQTFASSFIFFRKKVLKVRKGFLLSIPVVIGSLAGAQIAASMNEKVLHYTIAGLMLVMMIFVLYKPSRWLKGKEGVQTEKLSLKEIIIYLLIGVYGGFIHIGVGILLLAALVLVSGYDLLHANALKVFIVFVYSPFALAVFMMNGQVNYAIGLISSIGNLFGGILASYMAVSWGARFLQWVLVIVILFSVARSFGVMGF